MPNRIQKTIAFWLACTWAVTAYAQTESPTQSARVEKSTFGIQTGVLGLWGYHEWGLSRQITLRSELGLYATLYGGTGSREKTNFVLTTIVTTGPRWYYNLAKRRNESKDITGNSGNFIALQLSFSPGWLFYSSEGLSKPNALSILPAWGMRRNIGRHFNYEIGLGVGYIYYFVDSRVSGQGYIYPHLRIGYRF